MGLSFRPARPEDLDRLVMIHTAAYPDDRSFEARVRNFTTKPLGELGDLWVAEEAGRIAGHAFLFAMRAWFGGAAVPVGGIATVGVAPDCRGRGVASRLVEQLQAIARARGDAVTLLHPSRHGFYARLGYAPVSPYRHLRFLPGALRLPAGDPSIAIREADGGDREGIMAAWVEAGRRRTGTIVRTPRVWEARWAEERTTWLVAKRDNRTIEGYVAWTVARTESTGETTLTVRETVACSPSAARALWAAVAAQRDQVDVVHADVPEDDPLDRLLVDAVRAGAADSFVSHPLGTLAAGPMIRIADVATALRARGWSADGELAIDAGGGPFHLRVVRGAATIDAAGGPPAPDLRLDRAALAAVAFGALRPSNAASLGMLEASDPGKLALADALFALPAYFSADRF